MPAREIRPCAAGSAGSRFLVRDAGRFVDASESIASFVAFPAHGVRRPILCKHHGWVVAAVLRALDELKRPCREVSAALICGWERGAIRARKGLE
jgi:hypothetical protein